jgi:hypothetical protein
MEQQISKSSGNTLKRIVVLFATGFLVSGISCCFCFALAIKPQNRLIFFYTPQIIALSLFLWATVILLMAIKKHELRVLKTYIPALILVIYLVLDWTVIHSLGIWGINRKVYNQKNLIWSESMMARAMGGWPTGDCVLSNHVALLLGEWSLITPDGHMPAITWTNNGEPDPDLPSNPQSCKRLKSKWYFCYLSKPYELKFEESGICDLRKRN